MAERLGISRAAYMKYETGEQIPDLEMLCRIGEIFRVGRKEGKRSNPCRVAGMVEESKAQYGCCLLYTSYRQNHQNRYQWQETRFHPPLPYVSNALPWHPSWIHYFRLILTAVLSVITQETFRMI